MEIVLEKVDSLSELRERLRQGQPSVMLGVDDDSTNEYFLTSLSGCRVGICSQGQGIRPSVLQSSANKTIWVGYNSKVVNLDTSKCHTNFVVQLDSVFISLLCEMQDGSVIVIHELGAVRISNSGSVLWNISTDVLTGFEDGGQTIDLTTEEGSIRVDKNSGKRS